MTSTMALAKNQFDSKHSRPQQQTASSPSLPYGTTTMTLSDEQRSTNERPSSSSPSRTSSGSIRQELQQLRGDLFDISDADSSIGMILTKVQQLTEFENRVVEEQRNEIGILRGELEQLRHKEKEDQAIAQQDSFKSVPSFDSITMNSTSSNSTSSSSSGGFTNESERDSSYSIVTNQQLAQKANLAQSIAATSEELQELNSFKARMQEDIAAVTEKLRAFNSSKERIQQEIDHLKKQVQLLLQERTKLIQEVEVYTHQSELAYELEMAHESNTKLMSDMETLRERSSQALLEERQKAERAAQHEKQTAQQWNANFQREVERAKRAAECEKHEKEMAVAASQEEVATEVLIRKEMQQEMQRLYEEKIVCEKELDDLKRGIVAGGVVSGGNAVGGGMASNHAIGGADTARIMHEIQMLRDENASLRSTTKRDSEVIASLNDEIHSLISVDRDDTPPPQSPPATPFTNMTNAANTTPVTNNTTLSAAQAAAATRKRALVLSQGSVGEDERSREYKRSIHYEPHKERWEQPHRERFNSSGSGSLEQISGPSRERLGSSGSGSLEQISCIGSVPPNREQFDSTGGGSDRIDDTVSALNDTDNVSLLFGQESVSGKSTKSEDNDGKDTIKSDHDGIRAHAEKLLYWANKASERSSKKSDASTVASQQPSQSQQQREQQGTITSNNKYASPIPKTIGLPPRSQSRVRKSSRLPPRCPPAPSSTSDGNSITLSDKENGGSSFNVRGEVPGAFPTVTPRRKKNVSLSETDTIIHNLDYMDDAPVLCCECTVSPFSGSDPQSEFYLPKLGLACSCGGGSSIINDRTSFSKNPTALSNILRPWQCDFLVTLGVATADALLKAHKADANDMARQMKKWRNQNNMAATRSKECYVALKIWSRTCKVVLRSIREQKEEQAKNGGEVEEDLMIEKPHFLDITFADSHTIASISTLGQFSSVGGDGRPFEMMEI